MKRLTALGLSVMMSFSLLTPVSANNKDDITGHWAEQDMRSLIKQDIMSGYGEGIFMPNKNISRAEFTSLIVRALDLKSSDKALTFTDVDESDWYYGSVAIATSNNIISGYVDQTFKPNTPLSRQEMAAIVVRALNNAGVRGIPSTHKYPDEGQIYADFLPSVKQLHFLEIMGGKHHEVNGQIYFMPRDETTRAETATILTRMMNVMANPKVIKTHTHYDYNYSHMLNTQVNGIPKVDGQGKYTASRAEVRYFTNPDNFRLGTSHFMQFLLLSESTGLPAETLNKHFLDGRGTLSGTGQAFIDAGREHKINELYLISHALHETGNGNSALARGIEVGLNSHGKPTMVTNGNRSRLTNIKTTYNMYGIGAYDNQAAKAGSERAYTKGWFTPSDAVIGGAAFINTYIDRGQNTLYKMKWNPDSPGYPQYATHVQWATLQAEKIDAMYNLLDTFTIKFDIPRFNNPIGPTKRPSLVNRYNVDERYKGQKGQTTGAVNFRKGPTTHFDVITKLPARTPITILGDNGGWYKVRANGQDGWVAGNYVARNSRVKSVSTENTEDTKATEEQMSQSGNVIETEAGGLELRSAPEYEDNVIHILPVGTEITVLERHGEWVEVLLGETHGFIDATFLPDQS